jgi:hypothetical protein
MNFFRELLDPNSKVSSKRFAGLVLIGAFTLASLTSLWVEVDDNALDLLKTGSIVGATLLGVNVVETFTNKKKVKEDEVK